METNFNIQYCNTPQCKICRLQVLDTNINFYSNLSHNEYMVNANGYCNTKNCIYLISCKRIDCHMQYTGFTTTYLNKRLSGHRANIINGTEGKVIMDHFTKHHSIVDMMIKPIFVCEKDVLRLKEKYWMQELNSIYPYGLNNRIEVDNVKDAYDHIKYNNDKPIYSLFNKVKNNRTKRGSRRNRNNIIPGIDNNSFNVQNFISACVINVGANIHKHCSSLIMSLTLEKVKSLFIYINSHLNDYILLPYNEHLIYVIKDICLHRIKKSSKNAHNIKHYITINFLHKIMNHINLKKVLLSNQNTQRLPIPQLYLKQIGISYKYTKPIRNMVTNYNETVQNPDWNQQCICNQYENFIDPHYGHVLTGDLNIFQDKATRTLLKKGLNYRLPQKVNREMLLTEYSNCIENLVHVLSDTTKTKKELFMPWKENVLVMLTHELDTHVLHLTNTPQFNSTYLKDFQKSFVITQVDKASKNIGIICKRFYLEVLQEELNSDHFEDSNTDKDAIISNYSQFLKVNYNLDTTAVPPSLPFIYWIPKFHKIPTGTRFITSGRGTVINLLSKKLTIGLKHLLNIEKNYCSNKYKYTGKRYFYVIEDNKEIIDYMITQNLFNQDIKFIQTYDFKTLYTDIPQQELINNITQFVTSVFQLKSKKYINFYHKHASFSDTKKRHVSFTKEEFILQITYLINNAFIYSNNGLKKLVIGIPTGTNCASDLANIFLHIYEKKNVEDLVEAHRLNRLSNIGDTFRYQDDLINFNSHQVDDNLITSIYPNSMTIQNTSTSYKQVSYLDLHIEIIDNQFTFKSYDKRRDFNFPIINFPNLRGNIPTNAAYGVFTAQLIRYCRINLKLEDFIVDSKNLVDKLLSQSFNKQRLLNTYRKFCKEYIHLWAHFGHNILDDMINIFS